MCNSDRISTVRLECCWESDLLAKADVFHPCYRMGLSKTQRTTLEKIRRARLQPQPRTSEEAYGQTRRMVAAQKSSGTASSSGPTAKG